MMTDSSKSLISTAVQPGDVADVNEVALDVRFFALIACAGSGSRAIDATPGNDQHSSSSKQYRRIAGKSLVAHTLAAFAQVRRLAGTLVVVSPDDNYFDSAERGAFDVVRCGGQTRAGSVLNGLRALQDGGAEPNDWVLVHDAARCLVTSEQIDLLIDTCANDKIGGLLAHRVPDTLKTADGERVTATVNRADKWLAQTPQMFRLSMLIDALRTAGSVVTDESSAIERLGLAPKLVAGSAENFKVTYPEDFRLAEAILQARSGQRDPNAPPAPVPRDVFSESLFDD
jgi:2-C-methyl-D-erythritol 4-phosphate cytidylyltransferase